MCSKGFLQNFSLGPKCGPDQSPLHSSWLALTGSLSAGSGIWQALTLDLNGTAIRQEGATMWENLGGKEVWSAGWLVVMGYSRQVMNEEEDT